MHGPMNVKLVFLLFKADRIENALRYNKTYSVLLPLYKIYKTVEGIHGLHM
jgi:hypothetical protein